MNERRPIGLSVPYRKVENKEMKCPECGVWSSVVETRDSSMLGFRRRRECANGHRFTTQEVVVTEEAMEQKQRDRLDAQRKQMVAIRESKRSPITTTTQTESAK